MTSLVLGSTGFLGRHLCPALRNRGIDILAPTHWQCDLTKDFMLPVLQQPFDYIFHLVAWTQAGDFCLTHGGDQWLINQKINTNVLAYWKEFQPKAKLITIGSSCAYGPGYSLREEDYMKGEPHESLRTYAMTKRMLLEGCRAIRKQFGLSYLHLVPATLYGPDYHVDGRQAHFVFDLIRKIIRGKEVGEQVVLWGDGYQMRELIYVKDFVDIMINRALEPSTVGIFNVGANEGRTIRQFAKLICDIVEFDPSKIAYNTEAFQGAREKTLDSIRWEPHTSLEDGLKKTIDWYLETGAWK